MKTHRANLHWILCLLACTSAEPATQPSDLQSERRFSIGEDLYHDDFSKGSGDWVSELENGGTVAANGGGLDIDVPAGCSVWFKKKLEGPVMIQYDATAISAGGENDRVSDLNCFWMASDSRSPEDIFATKRSGKFADYNQLKTYYVGLGGNGNTTTRFRRYIGDKDTRPLLPENDLKGAENLLVANQKQSITLVAIGSLVQFYRDGKRLFEMKDSEPYTSGWFAFRTTKSHLRIEHFRVTRLIVGDSGKRSTFDVQHPTSK